MFLLGLLFIFGLLPLAVRRKPNVWGESLREGWFEDVICLFEGLALLTNLCTNFDVNNDSLLLFEKTTLFICFLSWLIGYVTQVETLLDSLRRIAALFYLKSVLILFNVCYRLWFSMGTNKYVPADAKANRKLNVLVLSIGTRGDVQPFLYLGQEFQAQGHNVTICTLSKYRDLVERHGLSYHYANIEDIEETKFWRKCKHVSEVMEHSLPDFHTHFMKIGRAFYEAALEHSADVLVVTSTAQSIALSISEKLSIRTVAVKFAPDCPTRSFPAPSYEGGSLNFPIKNLFSWYHHWLLIGLAANRCKMGLAENEYRKEVLDLCPLKGAQRLNEMGTCLNICAFSEIILPKPRDWPGNFLITGWWLPKEKDLDSNSTSSASTIVSGTSQSSAEEELYSFLGVDKEVICITFGSMSPTAEAIGVVPMVIDSCIKAFGKGVKILVIGNRFKGLSGDAELRIINEAPYHKIFPLVKLVIHHGGAGTCASAIESRVPSIIVPILVWTDQPLWAHRFQSLGLGFYVEQNFALFDFDDEKAIKRLSEKFIEETYRALLKIEQLQGIQSIAELVEREKGVEKAVQSIIQHVFSFSF